MLTPQGALDLAAMRGLCDAARGLGVTPHRAFDLMDDGRAAVDAAVDLGAKVRRWPKEDPAGGIKQGLIAQGFESL